MERNDSSGNWFVPGREKLPYLDERKRLSSVKGASRTGAIVEVDEALVAAADASANADSVGKQLAAYELYLACKAMIGGIGTLAAVPATQKQTVQTQQEDARKIVGFCRKARV